MRKEQIDIFITNITISISVSHKAFLISCYKQIYRSDSLPELKLTY